MTYFDGMDIGSKIRAARTALKLTQRKLGKAAGVSASAVTQWEKGETQPDLDRLPLIEDFLNLPRGTLIYDGAPPIGAISSAKVKSDVDFSKSFPLGGETAIKDLPIYAGVKGSFDGTYADMTQPIEYRERPRVLDGVKDAFAVTVISDSMEPRYYHGEIVYVHPGRPIRSMDWVVVELEGHQGIVKRYRKQSSDYVELEQLNPPEVRRFKRAEIVAMYKIVLAGTGQ